MRKLRLIASSHYAGMNDMAVNLSGRIYYAKRVGWRWQVWFAYQNRVPDPASGVSEWLACYVKYWRWISAERAASSMQKSFNDGAWFEELGRRALERERRVNARPR